MAAKLEEEKVMGTIYIIWKYGRSKKRRFVGSRAAIFVAGTLIPTAVHFF